MQLCACHLILSQYIVGPVPTGRSRSVSNLSTPKKTICTGHENHVTRDLTSTSSAFCNRNKREEFNGKKGSMVVKDIVMQAGMPCLLEHFKTIQEESMIRNE